MMICYRAAKSGILTGVLLTLPEFRASAPLLLPLMSNQFLSWNEPIANLPVVIYPICSKSFYRLNNPSLGRCSSNNIICAFVNIFTRLFFQRKNNENQYD